MFAASLSISMHGIVQRAFVHHSHATTRPGPTVAFLKGVYACRVLYPPVSLAIRVSVCLFLLRLVNKKLYRHMIYALLGLESAASLGLFVATVFHCTPPSHFWKQAMGPGDGTCVHQALAAAGFVHGAISAFSACFVGVLPIFILWSIRVDFRTKATIIALLGMSIL